MKRLTLDQTWKECLKMWRWIAKRIKDDSGRDVEELKEIYLEEMGFVNVWNDCFFCEYISQRGRNCTDHCPGKKVDSSFSCTNWTYDYQNHPIDFLKKITQLNKKRKKK